MKQYATIIFFVFIFSSCIKEKSTYSSTIAVNTTNHYILVTPYMNGAVSNKDSFSLKPNTSKTVYQNSYKGIGNGTTYGYDIPYTDSVIVIFDNKYTIVHYNHILPTTVNTKSYLFSSIRNLYNDSSYIRELITESSNTKSWEFTYTFTEQDYLDAK